MQLSLVAEQDGSQLEPFPSPLMALLHTPSFSTLVFARCKSGGAITRTASRAKKSSACSFIEDGLVEQKDNIKTHCDCIKLLL